MVCMTSAIFLGKQVNISSNTTQAELEAKNTNLQAELRMEFYLFPIKWKEATGSHKIPKSRKVHNYLPNYLSICP